MKEIEQIINGLRVNLKNTRFNPLVNICTEFFGKPRVKGSHYIFSMPWPGDPRINLQKAKSGKAKPYQVKQVIAALERLKGEM